MYGRQKDIMTEEDDLVDLSVTGISDAPTSCIVQLARSSTDERWGFLLFNNRFPLTVGKVDNVTLINSLFKGDVIVAINGVSVGSFDSAAQIMRAAGLELSLTVDLNSEARQQRQREERAAVASAGQQRSSLQGPGKLSSDNATTSPGADSSPFTIAPGDVALTATVPQKVLKVDPITVAPSRSNVDVVLMHLPKPPRVATYNRHECPLGPEYGFTEAFHTFIQDFLTEQALGSSAPTNDLRYDAITAVMKSGIARLPNELIRDITQRGGEVLRKQEANSHFSSAEKDRFMTQMNAMNSIVQDKKRERQEEEEAIRQRAVETKTRVRESMQLYHRMCGDGDDNLFITSLASSSTTQHNNNNHHHHHGHHLDHLPLPSGQPSASFQTLMHHAMASAPLPVPYNSNPDLGAVDVTIHIPLSRKQRKKRRVQQLKEQVQASNPETLITAPIPSLENVGLPLPSTAVLEQLGGLIAVVPSIGSSGTMDLPLPPRLGSYV
ncbi:Hypothetical protein, putative [Bodo saltans]|uniref:PDZ domain-containing protein n=1 Tax=Bodo saltans TaxID=75058 RepID=A0A0S4JV31_BODSA|nr:Hypothetical protein, putative [Bodo saltans]|eukprot:CUG93249.1 Hypothetical protein, putative [Bodo saltans]